MATFDIYLCDPAGGGFEMIGNIMTVHHKNIRVIAQVADMMPMFDVGELRCTQAVLDKLGVNGVVAAFCEHLKGVDWCSDPEDRAANEVARRVGDVVYNADAKRGIILITYPGDNSTLIDSSEY